MDRTLANTVGTPIAKYMHLLAILSALHLGSGALDKRNGAKRIRGKTRALGDATTVLESGRAHQVRPNIKHAAITLTLPGSPSA